jgi:hypothetical protein
LTADEPLQNPGIHPAGPEISAFWMLVLRDPENYAFKDLVPESALF